MKKKMNRKEGGRGYLSVSLMDYEDGVLSIFFIYVYDI